MFLEECFRQFVLGFIQGCTEFLPISSTAHLKVIPVLLGWGDPGVSVTAAIQFGSIIAVFVYFSNDLRSVAKGFSATFLRGNWSKPNAILANSLIMATLPILFAGVIVKFFWPGYQISQLRTLSSIGIISIIMASILAIAEKYSSAHKSFEKISGFDGFFVGLAQVIALIPGASRSGVTITAGLIRGLDRNSAARFSFLIGIPAITFSGLVEIKDAIHSGYSGGLLPLFVGIATAAITSWFAIDFLLKFLQRNSTIIFVIYRFFFGSFLLVWSYLINTA
ncbi:undecaprenyl-diphosphate phosphatase [Prochlorococcus marinus]|nr:undecaprenyl-diphosphate phosphatase [Prochlorococcus marinus]